MNYVLNTKYTFYHDKFQLKQGPAEINGVIEPNEIADIPPRFELLFNEYPVPISFEEIGECSQAVIAKFKHYSNLLSTILF